MKNYFVVSGWAYREFFIVLWVSILSGCASLPSSKLHPLTDEMIQSSQGSFEKAWTAWLKPQFTDKNPQGKHIWIIATGNPEEDRSNENLIWQEFHRFCDVQGAVFTADEVQFGHQFRCATKDGRFIGYIETHRYRDSLALNIDTPEIQKQKEDELAENRRVQEEKIKAYAAARQLREYHDLTAGSLSIDELKVRIQRFENNDPESLVPLAQKKLAQMLVDQKNEAEAKRRRLEDKHVSDQVCAWSMSKVERSSPYTGRFVTDEKIKIVGFVEQIAGKRIQVRISGISYGSDSTPLDFLSNFNGGSTLKVGVIIWDSIYNWEGCN